MSEETQLPLSGVKVVDLTQGLSGPFSSLMLSDLGAEIIKVETKVGDIARGWGPPFVKDGMSAYFYSINRNKKSVLLNLKMPESREVFEKLLESTDVLIENFRPGVLEQLGYRWEKLHREHPGLILLSISGYGSSGPDSRNAAFDINIQARSGLMDITGDPYGEPTKIGIPLTDIGAGMYGAFAVSSALFSRNATGKGTRIDVAMFDTAISWLTYWVTGYSVTKRPMKRTGNAHTTLAPYQLFDTKDGQIALGVTSNRLWAKFAKAVNRPDLVEDERFKSNATRVKYADDVVKTVAAIIAEYNRDEIVELLAKGGIPCAPMQSISDLVKDKQALARNMMMQMKEAVVPGTPLKFMGKDPREMDEPPELGGYTKQLIIDELGMDEETYRKLLEEIEQS